MIRSFLEGCSHFDKRAFIYAVSNFPLHHELLKYVRFLSLFKQTWIFDDVMSPYVSLSKNEIYEMEQERLLLQLFIYFL